MQINCTQCAATVNLEEGAHFATCRYCSSALYVDKSRVVFHFVVNPTIDEEDALGKLRRWMAGNETVKDLDAQATITHQELIYFPMWRFVVREGTGEREYSEPACSFSISDIKRLPLSGGNLKFFSPADFQNKPLKEPDVLLDSAISWLEKEGVQRERIKESNLVHLPFYLFKYSFKNQSYQAVVDASSGRVLASIFPTKDEIPFIGMALLSTVVFFIAGVILPGFFWRLIVYLILSIPMGIMAYSIVKKY